MFVLAGFLSLACAATGVSAAGDLPTRFVLEVVRRLDVPADWRAEYAARAERALADAGVRPDRSQVLLLVDRNPNIQALFVFWRSAAAQFVFIGAAPVSTGRQGGFEYFETPLGVFAHSLDHPDFRAEGTPNVHGIRGYGVQGRRVFDFGWVDALRTWDAPATSPMRLQLHATDPLYLEPRLGSAQSKGCIRIEATLNDFIDRHGLLDADYEEALARGRRLWVLRPDRTPTPWSGRYLVVIDSQAGARPAWSPSPRR